MTKTDNLNYPGSSLIISLEKLEKLRPSLNGVVALTSGGYDPIHPGHISLITGTKRHLRENWIRRSEYGVADDIPIKLVVIVNNDAFLERKKGKAFIDHNARCQIVAGLKGVDFVVPFSPSKENDDTVCEAIERLRPTFFIKGGDRVDATTIPEWNVTWGDGVFKQRARIITGVGEDKIWSSRDYLNGWTDFVIKHRL